MKVKYEADLKNLSEMMIFICDQLKAYAFDACTKHCIELASEEALVNIIRHAYPNTQGYLTLSCPSSNKNYFEITIIDHGIPFNPLENLKYPPSSDKNDAIPLGGYGIYLILNLMDKIEYQRQNDENSLTLIKYLH